MIEHQLNEARRRKIEKITWGYCNKTKATRQHKKKGTSARRRRRQTGGMGQDSTAIFSLYPVHDYQVHAIILIAVNIVTGEVSHDTIERRAVVRSSRLPQNDHVTVLHPPYRQVHVKQKKYLKMSRGTVGIGRRLSPTATTCGNICHCYLPGCSYKKETKQNKKKQKQNKQNKTKQNNTNPSPCTST